MTRVHLESDEAWPYLEVYDEQGSYYNADEFAEVSVDVPDGLLATFRITRQAAYQAEDELLAWVRENHPHRLPSGFES